MQQLTFVTSHPDVLMRVHALEQRGGRVTGAMETGAWMRGPGGGVSAGSLGVLADNVLGYALMASLPQGSWSISTEIWIDILGAIPMDGSLLTAEAEPLQAGSFAAGRVMAAGHAVAECRQRGRRVEALTPGGTGSPRTEPPEAVALDALIGLRSEGDRHAMESTYAVANPRQMLHGGISLAATELVAAESRMHAGSSLATTSVHIVHTRGVPVGACVELRATTQHAGRSLWVTDVVAAVAGKACAITRVVAQP